MTETKRLAKIASNNTYLTFNLNSKLDLIIADDTITDNTVKQENIITNIPVTLEDNVTENIIANRYISLGEFKSPYTKFKINLFYDNKYKDIMLVPYLSFTSIAPKNTNIELTGYRIGSYNNSPLPVVNSLTGSKLYMCYLKGISSTINNNDTVYNRLNDELNIATKGINGETFIAIPAGCITGQLGVKMLYPMDTSNYNLTKVSIIDVSNKTLYVHFKF